MKSNIIYEKEPAFLLDESGLSRSYSDDSFWTTISGDNYFFKITNRYEALNEFIGCNLSKLIGLDTAVYQPARVIKNDGTILDGVISKDFDPKQKLILLKDLYINNKDVDNLSRVKELCEVVTDVDFNLFMDDFIKLVVVDYYSNQVDRCDFNIGVLNHRLAPVFDYSASFNLQAEYGLSYFYSYPFNNGWYFHDVYLYGNGLLTMYLPGTFYKQLVKKYPKMLSYLEVMYKLDLMKLITNIIADTGLKINNILDYAYFEKNKKSHLRTLIK